VLTTEWSFQWTPTTAPARRPRGEPRLPRDGRWETLTERDADVIRTHHAGRERTYAGRAAACLIAAGRFREQIEFHETRLAERVTREPIEAAREASGREGPPKRIAAETGLAETVASAEETGDVLRAHAGPTIAATRIASAPPPDAALVDRWEIDTGATVRLYEGAGPLRTYHLTPPRPGSTTRPSSGSPTPKTDCSMTQPAAATGHQGERCGRSRRPVTPSRHWSTCFDDTRADTARSSTCSLTTA